jgi:uncharacterized protein (TIGR00661 family)
MKYKHNILFSPLNWGLGHATRLVPLIDSALEEGQIVHLAGYGKSAEYLQDQFPDLPFHYLPGFTMRYAKGIWLIPYLLLQSPLFLFWICIEKRKTKTLVKKYSIAKIISDNRYGVRNKHTKSILVTHQVNLQLPKYLKPAQWIINKAIRYLINQFHHCLIPDFMGDTNLSGRLSHPATIQIPLSYIGPQSALKKQKTVLPPIIPDILIVLSGPEPQKSHLQLKLEKQLAEYNATLVFVGGSTEPLTKPKGNAHFLGNVHGQILKGYIESAKNIITRGGYSTIMDIFTLQKTAICIPTPSQWEQEYLACHLHGKHGFYFVKESQLQNIHQWIK